MEKNICIGKLLQIVFFLLILHLLTSEDQKRLMWLEVNNDGRITKCSFLLWQVDGDVIATKDESKFPLDFSQKLRKLFAV